MQVAANHGLLHCRIWDDILSDNEAAKSISDLLINKGFRCNVSQTMECHPFMDINWS